MKCSAPTAVAAALAAALAVATAPVRAETPPTEKDMILTAYSAAPALTQLAAVYQKYMFDAVVLATRLNGGRIAKTGTLTQVRVGVLRFGYAATPADRLKVVAADGATMEFFITKLVGKQTASLADFVVGNHAMRFRVVVPGQADLTLGSQRIHGGATVYEGRLAHSAAGTFTHQGRTLKVDLAAAGTYYFETSGGGHESRQSLKFTGTVVGAGRTFKIDETWQFISISAGSGVVRKGLVGGGGKAGGTITNDVRTINSSWAVGGTRYAFRDALIKTQRIDGKPALGALRSSWGGSGALLKDGKPYGKVNMTLAPGRRAWLTTPAGKILLQEWNR